MLALVGAAIHSVLSEYATGMKVTFIISEDKYQGKNCLSTVASFITAEATALINNTWWAASYVGGPAPPGANISIGAAQSELGL
jgi:hypothetical protein